MTTPKQTSNNIIREGYLQKQSLHLKKFRTRWIMLKDDCLYCYKTQSVSNLKPTEVIDLKLFNDCTKSLNIDYFEFELQSSKNKHRKFRTVDYDNEEDGNNWVMSICDIIHRLCPFHIYTKFAQTTQKKDNIISISIFAKKLTNYKLEQDKFIIHALYEKQETIKNVHHEIIQYLQNKYLVNIKIKRVQSASFIYENRDTYGTLSLEEIAFHPITNFSKGDLKLYIEIEPHYQHNIINESLSCSYLRKLNSFNASKCPIYKSMIEDYQLNEDNLKHLTEFTHFKSEYDEKPICRYGDECKAYIRCENGGNRIIDKCHIKLYRHPPRSRQIELSENIHSLIINKKQKDNHDLYKPTQDDKKEYKWDETNGWLQAVIDEVISNGFKYDLCLKCGKDDKCKHGLYGFHSILQIVAEKMESKRHKSINSPLNRGEMLSLIMYTGCDCNYDLCGSQRKGNYNKWKWFDYCLWNAIRKLSQKESGSFGVYTG
eukprot:203543_1